MTAVRAIPCVLQAHPRIVAAVTFGAWHWR
jgi:hypothetical protein